MLLCSHYTLIKMCGDGCKCYLRWLKHYIGFLNCIYCGYVKCIHYFLIHLVKQRWISAGQINIIDTLLSIWSSNKNLGLLSLSVLLNMSQHIMVDIFSKTSAPKEPSPYLSLPAHVQTPLQHLIFNADCAYLNNDCPSLFLFYCSSLFFGWPVLSICLSFISV